jgi:hypothetical protein
LAAEGETEIGPVAVRGRLPAGPDISVADSGVLAQFRMLDFQAVTQQDGDVGAARLGALLQDDRLVVVDSAGNDKMFGFLTELPMVLLLLQRFPAVPDGIRINVCKFAVYNYARWLTGWVRGSQVV